MAVEPRRQPEELREPVERHLLELLQRGRRAPEDPDLIEPRDQQLREDSWLGGGRREVREEARALPVREPRHEHRVEVAEHARRTAPASSGGEEGSAARIVSGLDLREDGKLGRALEIGRDPLDRGRAVVAKR